MLENQQFATYYEVLQEGLQSHKVQKIITFVNASNILKWKLSYRKWLSSLRNIHVSRYIWESVYMFKGEIEKQVWVVLNPMVHNMIVWKFACNDSTQTIESF